MNLLHLNTERGWRGGERQTFWLARELAARGHFSAVACRPHEPLGEKAAAAGLPVFFIAPLGEFDVLSAWRLRRYAASKSIDVIHAHTGHAAGLAALASLGAGRPLVATRRVDFPLRRHFLSRWKYSRPAAIAAISENVRRVLSGSGIAPEKMALIHSGIDASGYPSRKDKDAFRRKKGYPIHDALVVSAGALVPHKDPRTLLKAAALVCQNLTSARFLILGEGELRGELESLARSSGILGQVEFLGHRQDVLEYMAMADVFVMSSKEEGLGTALLDAFAIGVPVSATRAGGIPEMFGAAGDFLVPPNDPALLAGDILRVLQDPAEGERRSALGRERAKEFTVGKMTDLYEKLYSDLLRGALS